MRAGRDLPDTPNIRAQFPGRKLPVARVVNRRRKFTTTCDRFPGTTGIEDTQDGLWGPAREGGEHFALCLQGRARALHTLNTNTYRKQRKGDAYGKCKIAENLRLTETVQMRTWNWELFKNLVKAKEASGTPVAEQAMALGMEEATLRGYVEQRSRPPSKKLLDLAPDYYQVELDDLWIPAGQEQREVEIRHARTFLRDCLNAEEATAYTDDEALGMYRLAKSTLAFAKTNAPKRG